MPAEVQSRMYSRQAGRFTLPGFGGPSGPPPRDVIAILVVLFVTFSCQFFASTAIVPALMWLSPDVWQRGFVWQLITYPFAGIGRPGLGIVLEFLILFWFARDVYLDLGRRRFWRLILPAAIVAALAALAADFLAGHAGGLHPDAGSAGSARDPDRLVRGAPSRRHDLPLFRPAAPRRMVSGDHAA